MSIEVICIMIKIRGITYTLTLNDVRGLYGFLCEGGLVTIGGSMLTPSEVNELRNAFENLLVSPAPKDYQ